jgi:hypothetical protein
LPAGFLGRGRGRSVCRRCRLGFRRRSR